VHSLLRQLRAAPAPPSPLPSWLDALVLGARAGDTAARVEAALGPKTGGCCAYQFRPGEPAYQCSFCGSDPTCISCVRCYQQADHSGHEDQVRMVNAGGGGCCDCGDSASWRAEGTCRRHRAATSEDESGGDRRPAADVAALFDQAQMKRMKAVVDEIGCTELQWVI